MLVRNISLNSQDIKSNLILTRRVI